LAVMLVFVCVSRLTNSWVAACLSAGSLALAHTFWQNATRAECNTLAAALLAAEACCIVAYGRDRRPGYLILLCFVNGLALANHPLALLTTPIAVVLVITTAVGARESLRGPKLTTTNWKPGKLLAMALALWIVGAGPYLRLILLEWHRNGDFIATLHSALFGHDFADEVLNMRPTLRGLAVSTGFILLNFPNLLLPAAVCGIFRARAAGIPVVTVKALMAALVLHAVFALRYPVVDQHTFLIPTYVLLSIFGGIGFWVWSRSPARLRGLVAIAAIMLILTPVTYALVPVVARRFNVLASVERHKPYRDDYVYVFTPWSCADNSADVMSKEAVRLAQPTGTILVEDPMAVFAVRYHAIRSQSNITIVDVPRDGIVGEPPQPPIVWVPANTQRAPLDAVAGPWRRIGDLYIGGGESR